MSKIPWIESWRPAKFEDIVLDPLNKIILTNIIETSYFPNLLLYGPPGTGKTTTIINLINAYQEKLGHTNKDLMIHLNASDERGIDIIRNQINQFVNSNTLFSTGMKFVVLDEVDYMTKNAQQALKYMLQSYSNNVRFCLMCNYISRIDEGLQNEFLKLRFNQLPETDIILFLKKISEKENINISDTSLSLIQKLYRSDIRSMINFMQLNQNYFYIIDNEVWAKLYDSFSKGESSNDIENKIQHISIEYNIDKKNIIKDFMNYIIRYRTECVTTSFLNFVENIMHSQECKNTCYVNYSISRLKEFVK
jgi:DNA polymerase III delta prime subunit